METVENEKGFRVLKIDRTELLSKTARFGAIGVCDRCGHAPHTGYYVAVLNYWLCPDCFRNWYQDAEHYEEDLAYEEKKVSFLSETLYVSRTGRTRMNQ